MLSIILRPFLPVDAWTGDGDERGWRLQKDHLRYYYFDEKPHFQRFSDQREKLNMLLKNPYYAVTEIIAFQLLISCDYEL